jgi:DNA topoisomerase I
MSVDFDQFLIQNQLSSSVLDNLGILNELKSLFNSDLDTNELKIKAKELIFKSISPINISRFSENTDQISQEKDKNDEISSAINLNNSLVLKPAVINGVKKTDIKDESEAIELSEQIVLDPFFKVGKISFSKLHFKPKAPFTTSTLQQAASSYLGMSPKTTMSLAQKLYEGVDFNSGQTALITYMRTDSTTLSDFVLGEIKKFLTSNFPKFMSPVSILYKSKSKNAQEAHEAIRPTDISITPQKLHGKLDNSLWRLYDLIWRQTVASQMTDEIREKKSFTLTNSLSTSFNGAFLVTLEEGWRALFPRKNND